MFSLKKNTQIHNFHQTEKGVLARFSFGALLLPIVMAPVLAQELKEGISIELAQTARENQAAVLEGLVFENKPIDPAMLLASAAKEREVKAPLDAFDATEVEKAAAEASKLTGIRQEFLMGALTVETELGQNVGQCTYREVAEGAERAHYDGRLGTRAWNTFLTRQEQIKDLARELGYDYEKLKVSCNPSASIYAGTGGAMGIAQFMPSTWYEYKDRLVALTGKAHPDPWNVRDGVLAMALKLSDVPGVTEHDRAAEKRASKLYLSGSTSWQYEWYANETQYWAENHPELLGELTTLSLILQ